MKNRRLLFIAAFGGVVLIAWFFAAFGSGVG
jgi:hypothetical protein